MVVIAVIKGKPGEWYQDEHIGGYFAEDGHLIVCEEYGLSDADIDKYAVEVMNGDGYYDEYGIFRRYATSDYD